jgi:hypothetical protein
MATLDLSPKGIRTVADGAATDTASLKTVSHNLSVTVNAEAPDNFIDVQIDILDFDGSAFPGLSNLAVEVLLGSFIHADHSTEFEASAGALGNRASIPTTKASYLFETDATGVVNIVVGDIVGASGSTVYLMVTPMAPITAAPIIQAITFD